MYPFGGIPENLVAFCDFLRREHGFAIGPGEVRDAARAVEIVRLADERAVRDTLRPIFSRSFDEAAIFDRAFDRFFYPGPRGVPQPALPPERQARRRDSAAAAPDLERPGGSGPPEVEAGDAGGAPQPVAPDAKGAGDSGTLALVRASYSPLEAESSADTPELGRVDAPWHSAANAFVRRLHLGMSRRWRPASSGRRFDLRRTLRTSIRTGGEALAVRWLRRPKRSPRFVVLVDGSRSMTGSAAPALQLAVALASATMRVEVFTFSTALRRVTAEVRRAAAGETVRLRDLGPAWGGGTGIGASFRTFLQRFGARLLRRDTLVIVASDGLDLGDRVILRDAVRELRRRSAGVVWLNPLFETAGYEPTAGGMAAALPHVTALTSVDSPAALARLSRQVRVRT